MDASYTYYAHGPLRRTVLGRDLVQGLDYTYTIAGWLKGINLPTLNTSDDPGKDGLATGSNPTVGRDAFGMQLHYHNGDFTDGPSAFTGTRSEASFKGLYNGNIAGWSYTSRSENGTPQTTMLSTYSYDKLNRLKQDQPHTMVGNVSTTSSKWSSNYSYDLDGNITNLERKDGSGSGIDNLSYVYPASGGKTITNRLRHIVDYLTPNDNGKGVVGQDPDNYSYDATGNLTADATEGITSITWTPYNKIRELVKTNATPATGTTTLRYLYDAAGNRVVKDYHATQNTTLTSRTWYIRDAQGTVLAIYTRKPTAGNGGSVTRTEAPIYGSSRIGQSTRTATYDASASGEEATLLGTVYSRELGKRAYELVDHLGNVRATISDILVPRTATNTYDADILTLTNYYPFGMQMDTRTWEASGVAGHRYGYNGKENDDEVKGQGNQQDYGFRIYDPRVARFLSVDPLAPDYPSWSPYPFAMNRPIDGVDLDGLEWSSVKTVDQRGNVQSIVYTAKIKVVNSSSLAGEEYRTIAQGIANSIEKRFSGKTADGVSIRVTVQVEHVSNIREEDYAIEFVDNVRLPDGTLLPGVIGLAGSIGNSQSNRMQVLAHQSRDEAILTGTHEVGHTLGLRHENDELNPDAIRRVVTTSNIMHHSAPNTNDIHPLQRGAIESTIPTQAILPALVPVVRDKTNVQLPPRK